MNCKCKYFKSKEEGTYDLPVKEWNDSFDEITKEEYMKLREHWTQVEVCEYCVSLKQKEVDNISNQRKFVKDIFEKIDLNIFGKKEN